MTDKSKAILARTRKTLGKDSATIMGADLGAIAQYQGNLIPTGIDVIDNYIIGVGGLPEGRIIELFSEESGGKTTFGHTFLAAAQRAGGTAVLAETEQVFDPSRAAALGVDLNTLIILNGEYLEVVVEQIEGVLDAIREERGWPAVIVWDSIAQTPTKSEWAEGFGAGSKPGERAKALSEAMRTLAGRVKKARCVLVCINQVRDNIGVMFGAAYTTPGGHAVKFAASVRLQIFGGKAIKNKTGEHEGKDITLVAVKNKLAPPWRKCRVRLWYDERGWDNQWSTVSHAKDREVIPKGTRYDANGHMTAAKALGWKLPVIDTTAEDVDSEETGQDDAAGVSDGAT